MNDEHVERSQAAPIFYALQVITPGWHVSRLGSVTLWGDLRLLQKMNINIIFDCPPDCGIHPKSKTSSDKFFQEHQDSDNETQESAGDTVTQGLSILGLI
jgi:hypothetical protein